MINTDIIYKIRYLPIDVEPGSYGDKVGWVTGYNGIPYIAGSGKTFTNPTLVNRMFERIYADSDYGTKFVCEIVTFQVKEISASGELI